MLNDQRICHRENNKVDVDLSAGQVLGVLVTQGYAIVHCTYGSNKSQNGCWETTTWTLVKAK